jgi:type II secretory pathway pseudopilin PulG
MKTRKLQVGLTLIDMLIAVAIIAALASIVITALARIDSKAQENLCEGTLETLNSALRQYRDYKLECRIDTTDDNEREFYRSLKFPPDCNDFTVSMIQTEIEDLLDISPVIIEDTANKHDPNESGGAVMYFFLSMVPECRQTLGNIDQALLKSDHKISPASKNYDEDYLMITIGPAGDNRSYPWIRVIDPWGKALRYDYYDETEVLTGSFISFGHASKTIRSFPLITSAGPDGEFGTDDDITNRDKTKAAEYTP